MLTAVVNTPPPNSNVPKAPEDFTPIEAKHWYIFVGDLLPEFLNPSCLMLVRATAEHAARLELDGKAIRSLRAKGDTSVGGVRRLAQLERKHSTDTRALGNMMAKLRLTPESRIRQHEVEKASGHRRPGPWAMGKLPMQQNGYGKED